MVFMDVSGQPSQEQINKAKDGLQIKEPPSGKL